MKKLYLFASLLLALTACSSAQTPQCPYKNEQLSARSAGCFSVKQNSLLMVQGLNGAISVPGGSSEPPESARCTAFRETWEETGLKLQAKALITTYDNGFHLYRCELNEHSGKINPQRLLEIQAAFYLPVQDFDKYTWRFPEKKKLFENLLRSSPSN